MDDTTKPAIPLSEANRMAARIVGELGPYCERIEVAGSIRRRKDPVGDIEIVAIPRVVKTPQDLFGTVFLEDDLLHAHCNALKESGVLADRLDKNGRPAWGLKLKRTLYHDVPLDLFTASPDNWGLIFLIRTGPALWNHWLVSKTADGGAMPFGMRVHEGQLWRGNTVIPTPDEESVFAALELAYRAPWLRLAPAGWGMPGAATPALTGDLEDQVDALLGTVAADD